MRVAVGQMVASEDWSENLATCTGYVKQAADAGADLLVLPEGVLVRFTEDRARVRTAAQPLDGPFVTGLVASTAGTGLTVVVGVHEPGPDGRAYNTLVVAADGRIVTVYRKLHLYDAFGSVESENVIPADDPPVTFTCAGLTVGLMTCYDVRFPELARLLATAGAEVLVLPAAWVKGPLKERHWELMLAARAVENTVYVVGSGECGARNIGHSMVVDPLGVVSARLAEEPGLLFAELSAERVADARRRLPVLANRRFDVDPTPRTSPASEGVARCVR
ncbi:MAG TPA: nitrilase-related carbon-nitrogen hydrolase [Actinocatenispora sp.]